MLVVQLAGRYAGETLDMPAPVARRLIELGSVRDAREPEPAPEPQALAAPAEVVEAAEAAEAVAERRAQRRGKGR